MSNDMQNDELRARLDRAAAELDDITVAKLRAARKRAAEAAGRDAQRAFGWLPWSAAAAALAAVTAVSLWWRAPEPTLIAGDEIEWSLTRDDPEFFTDLDFYDWIRREQDAG